MLNNAVIFHASPWSETHKPATISHYSVFLTARKAALSMDIMKKVARNFQGYLLRFICGSSTGYSCLYLLTKNLLVQALQSLGLVLGRNQQGQVMAATAVGDHADRNMLHCFQGLGSFSALIDQVIAGHADDG